MKGIASPIPADTVKLYDIEVEKFLKEALIICPEAMEEEFVRVPSDLAYWNERHSDALHEALATKVERERISGELMNDKTFLDDLEEVLGKRPNLDQVKGAIVNDDRYIAAKVAEMGAEVERVRLRGCVDALAAKRDMLISLGAHVRLEMMHDPMLRRQMAANRSSVDVGDIITGDGD